MKIRLENSIDPLGQDPTKNKNESGRWEPSQQNFLLPIDRPVDRQRSDFRPLGKTIDRTVDRGSQTESETLCRSTKTNREHCSCFRSTGRSAALWCLSVDRLVDRQSSFALPAVDSPVDRLRAKTGFWVSLQNQSFFNKFSFDK